MENTELDSKIAEILYKLEDVQKNVLEIAENASPIQGWCTELQTQKILGLKTTALWGLRKQNLIRYSKIGAKTFYNLESIKKLLEKNQQ
jgi:hypothetical protein